MNCARDVVCTAILALFVFGIQAQEPTKLVVENASAARRVKVYILAGQSNAVGFNDHRQYQQGKSPLPDEFMNQPKVLFWGARSASWISLRVGSSRGSSPVGFGPEIGFANAIAKRLSPDEQIAIVKFAVGGTGIARSRDYTDYIPSLKGFDDKGRNWHPPAEGQEAGLLYKDLVTTVSNALSNLSREGRNYEVVGLLWVQGEHEAGISQKMAADYGKLLKALIHAVRTELRNVNLPVAVAAINSHAWAYRDIACKAQADACREENHVVLVKTEDLSRNGSGGRGHFDADGMLELGRRLADALHPSLTP